MIKIDFKKKFKKYFDVFKKKHVKINFYYDFTTILSNMCQFGILLNNLGHKLG